MNDDQNTLKKEKLKLWTQSLQSRFELVTDINNNKKWILVINNSGSDVYNNNNQQQIRSQFPPHQPLQQQQQQLQQLKPNINNNIIRYWKSYKDDLNNHFSKLEIVIQRSPIKVSQFIADETKYCLWNRLLTNCNLICNLIDVGPSPKTFQHSALMYAKPSLKLPYRDICFIKYYGPHPTVANAYVVRLKSVSTPLLCPSAPNNTRVSIDYGFSLEPFKDDPSSCLLIICLGIDFSSTSLDQWTKQYIYDFQNECIQMVEKLKQFAEMDSNQNDMMDHLLKQGNSKKKKKTPLSPTSEAGNQSSEITTTKPIIFIDNNNIFEKKSGKNSAKQRQQQQGGGDDPTSSTSISIPEDPITTFKKSCDSPYFSNNPNRKCYNITVWANAPDEFRKSSSAINDNISFKSSIFPFKEMNEIFSFKYMSPNTSPSKTDTNAILESLISLSNVPPPPPSSSSSTESSTSNIPDPEQTSTSTTRSSSSSTNTTPSPTSTSTSLLTAQTPSPNPIIVGMMSQDTVSPPNSSTVPPKSNTVDPSAVPVTGPIGKLNLDHLVEKDDLIQDENTVLNNMISEIQDYIHRQTQIQNDFYFIYKVSIINCNYLTSVIMSSHFDLSMRKKAHPFSEVTNGYEKDKFETFKLKYPNTVYSTIISKGLEPSNIDIAIKVTKIDLPKSPTSSPSHSPGQQQSDNNEGGPLVILEEHGNGDLVLYQYQFESHDDSIIKSMEILYFFRNCNWTIGRIIIDQHSSSTSTFSSNANNIPVANSSSFSFYDQVVQTFLSNYFPVIDEYQKNFGLYLQHQIQQQQQQQ